MRSAARHAAPAPGLWTPAPPLATIDVVEPVREPFPLPSGVRIKLAPDRAAPIPLRESRRHQIAACLERMDVLARDRYDEPLASRGEIERRVLAQADALAVLGMRAADAIAFWEATEPSAETAWVTAFLLAAWDEPGALDVLAAFLVSLTGAPFSAWLGAADALAIANNPSLPDAMSGWLAAPSSLLRATAIDVLAQRSPSSEARFPLLSLADPHPYLRVAELRRAARSPHADARALLLAAPLSHDDRDLLREERRARLLLADTAPLARAREGASVELSEALAILAVETLALAGEAVDEGAMRALLGRLPRTEETLDAAGRFGVPSVAAWALPALDDRGLRSAAREALATAFGEAVAEEEEDARAKWTAVVHRFARDDVRYRGGAPWSERALLTEATHERHGARALRVRLDELAIRSGRRVRVDPARWGEEGSGALREAARALAR